MVAYLKSDLEFILQQILIAEAHAAGADPSTLVPNSFVPFGLRTVDGSFNNLFPGQSAFGAADTLFPRLLDPMFRTAQVQPADFFGPGPAGSTPTSYLQTTGSVFDSQPRTISNLIVDQTVTNPVAYQVAYSAGADGVFSYLAHAGQDGLFGTADDGLGANGLLGGVGTNADTDDVLNDGARIINGFREDDGNPLTSEAFQTFQFDNATPDEGLSAPFNTWMTFFGQFFDHGLDLVTKGGNDKIYIPLLPDDPLYVVGGHTNFMVVTRATQFEGAGADGILANDPTTSANEAADNTFHEAENTTSPFVDQNQTYSSHPSHQVFLRAYERVGDVTFATGKLITNRDLGDDGAFGGTGVNADTEIGGMATWKVVKAQALAMLGIRLTDADIATSVPLLATDAYGKFIPGLNGYAQVVVRLADNSEVLVSGTAAGLDLNDPLPGETGETVVRTGHAFLNDVAHNAVPGTVFDANGPATLGGITVVQADADTIAGNVIATDFAGRKVAYDDELLDAHYIAGDGRVNENIGLISVHHVFHAEHNRLVEHTKDVAIASNDAAFVNQWLLAGSLNQITQAQLDAINVLPTGTQAGIDAKIAAIDALNWDGERLFQAAKFGTEMQYQHLVFEEFARKVQPQVDLFLVPTGFDTTIDAAIVAEFAHAVYRFGHSMLTETIDRLDPNFLSNEVGLIQAFLNPLMFATSGPTPDEAAGAIIRGLTRQVGNEIDEFVTEALRNNLVGLPLDLAAINIARGRDTGIPSLNAAREQFFAMTTDSQLEPYTSWVDFAQNLRHPESLINFIAAYGTHDLITTATTLDQKRAAATAIVLGGAGAPGDRLDFLNATGAYTGGSLGGLNKVDLWIGGLAEKQMPFGGLLGSTFNFVFETQLENLQNGDRFYYLARTAGMNFGVELENNSFAKLIMANTDVTHLPAEVFTTPAFILEVDQTTQFTGLGVGGRDDPIGGITIDGFEITPLVIRDNPATLGLDSNYLQYTGVDHVVLGGTAGDDIIIASIGDDTIWGDGGNDTLEGGDGVDNIDGGAGDDIITDRGGDDILKGNDGNDVISGGNGLNILFGGAGSDFIITGEDVSDTFGGTGNDFILGAQMNLPTFGNEGDDWIEIGTSDGAAGDNFDPLEAGTVIGHDVAITGGGFDSFDGEGGDDIMVFSDGEDHFTGGGGFDWASYGNDRLGVTADLLVNDFIEPPVTPSNQGIRDRFAEVEGLSGSAFSDILRGDDADLAQITAVGPLNGALNQAGIDRVTGLQDLLGAGVTSFGSGNIILGGGGSDIIEGRGGDDLIDGDRILNVRISVREGFDATGPIGGQIATFQSMSDPTLLMNMLNGVWNPGQLQIAREILPGAAGFDTAMFSGLRADYDIVVNDGGTPLDFSDDIVTVTDNSVRPRDGIDRLTHIERLQFADQAVVLTPGLNAEPVGVLTIDDPSPEINQVLTASAAGVSDADNPGGTITNRPITFIWQAERVPGDGVFTDIVALGGGNPETAHGNTFRVTADVDGLALRVRAVYQDADGTLENVFSAATGAVTGVATVPIAPVVPVESATVSAGVRLIRADLQFMLEQIKLAEANPDGNVLADISNSRLPFGLRTVDGTFNNLVRDQTHFGAADQNFPLLLDQIFRNELDGDTFDANGPAPGGLVTNTNYATTGNPSPGVNGGNAGNVADVDPRIISNLIVDMTANNPSAVTANGGNAPVVSPGLDGVFGTPDDKQVFFIPNATPDEGLSAQFNSWFTFFGQFFDHGLDLLDKGGNGTVYIPLMPDDPLFVPGGFTNFMVVTRASNTAVNAGADGILGTSDDVHFHNNETTPFIDQNQTYTSHASHQVFLREYVLRDLPLDGIAGPVPVNTGRLIDGANGGIGNWAEVKAQAATMLGIQLTDANIFDVPLLATDAYGKFIPGANGFAQFVTTNGLVEANPADNGGFGTLVPPNALFTGNAFLNDIAHNAVPGTVFDANGPDTLGGITVVQADADTIAGNFIATDFRGRKVAYDDELLDAHFITGDGRGNENIGLTSVHFIFHAEHNRMVDHIKDVAIASNDVAFLNEWLASDVAALPTTQAQIDALVWDGERIFQAARFSTEMQYQHLVFEEFARKVQPQVDIFLMEGQGYDSTINPAIVAEFAHVVYRFGHSMLTETIDRFDPSFNVIDADPLHPSQDASGQQIGLIAAFLNPLAFAASGATPAEAAGAIIRGLTRQAGNEIDEFVTEALRNNLVGLPLDLPAINLARGRDTGVPTLNQAREEFFSWTGDTQLKPYTSWADFVQNIKHPESLINFIAAYGTHASITSEDATAGKRAAAMELVLGIDQNGGNNVAADRLDFLNATGAYAPDGAGPNDDSRGGLNNIDLWIGGLAEKQMPFGGLLGSTFNYVFENQMEKLQNGDRFYYLERTAGLNFLTELENNSFAKLIMANTDTTHLPGDVFSTPTWILEVDQSKQYTGIENVQQAIGQAGTIAVTQTSVDLWTQVLFDGPIADAVVVMMVNTNNGPDPAFARVRNVTPTGFEFKIDEWEEDNGRGLVPETLSWLAMSAGDHVLPDGTHIRAGVRAVDNNPAHVSFGTDFTGAPVVLTQVSSVIDPSSVTTRLTNVTAAGFDVRVQEQQINLPAHGVEQVGWIAIEQGVTATAAARATDLIGHVPEPITYDPDPALPNPAFLSPVFLAQMQTQFDLQTAAVRGYLATTTQATVFVQEETSVDPDITHADENVGFVALSAGVILPEIPKFNADPTEGGTALTPLVIRNNPATPGPDTNYLQYTGVDHVVLGGTAADDILISSIGDDTLYGDGGNDRLEGGDGVDMILGGTGDDIITDKGGDDNLQGGEGNDAIHAGNGINLILGGYGNDFIVTGEDSNEAFGGPGNDFIFGTRADEMQFGNEGDDWIEHGMADGSAGENFDTRGLDSIIGHDVFMGDTVSDRMLGEGGDDIMLGNGGQIDRYIGSSGFDWAAYKNHPLYKNENLAANVDMNLRAFNEARVPASVASVLDRFESVEGLSGSSFGDILRGDDLDAAQIAVSGFSGSVLTNFALVEGLRAFVAEAGDGADLAPDTADDRFGAGNIILGGDGSDLIEGRGGDDLIDGDLALNVRIRRVELDLNGNPVLDGDGLMIELETFDSMIELTPRVFSGEINPGSLFIVREILPLDIGAPGFIPDPDFDTALYSGNLADYIVDIDGRNTLDFFDDIVTVTHVDATAPNGIGIDGVDRLTHIERLQFADQSMVLVPGLNSEPLGLLTILNAATGTPDTTPQTGQLLRVSIAGVTDANNVSLTNLTGAVTGPISFVWQFERIPGTGIFEDILVATGLGDVQATGETFTVTDDLGALVLRVRALFQDANGVLETVFSAPTAAVELPVPPVITGTAGADTLTGTDFSDVILGLGGDDVIAGGLGNDTIFGDGLLATGLDGDDIIEWRVGDGRDVIDGGGEVVVGDTFDIRGDAAIAETFGVFTTAAWILIAGNNLADLAVGTEIVITRNGTNFASVIAELNEIEELVINNAPAAAGVDAAGDTITIVGDFSTTSLNLATITINGTAGNDIIDITGLESDHRIVFRSNGGNDTIVGTLRPQDVIELAPGQALADPVDNEDGTSTVANGTGSITFKTPASAADAPQIVEFGQGGNTSGDGDGDGDEDTSGEDTSGDGDEDTSGEDDSDGDEDTSGEEDDTCSGEDDGAGVEDEDTDDNNTSTGGSSPPVVVAGAAGVTKIGSAGRDTLLGGAGDDRLFGEDGDDRLFGEDGNDRVFAGNGDDLIFGDAGRDVVYAGAGNDTIFASAGDGNDVYHGESGIDTLDFEAISANLTIDLGTADGGSASSRQTGFDTLDGIENVRGGAGNDTITGNASVNMLNGGAGGDILTGGAGADVINVGVANDDVIDTVRFSEVVDFGDTINNFDANGGIDRIEFGGTLAAAYDDGNSNGDFLFATGNGAVGEAAVTIGQAPNGVEALLLTGVGGEGVTSANLSNAGLVAAAFNAEFVITAANGEDALLVINDTDGNGFSVWQWVQAGGDEIEATELTHIANVTSNVTVTTASFDFFV